MINYRSPYTLAVSLAAVAALGACTQDSGSTDATSGPSIVATTTILGSVAEQLASCALEKDATATSTVRTLMPIGTDSHDFQPSSEQVAAMLSADIVIANGLGLEEGLLGTFEQLEKDGANLWLTAEWINPIEFAGHGHSHDDDHDHGHKDDHDDDHDHDHGHKDDHDDDHDHDHGHKDDHDDDHDHDHGHKDDHDDDHDHDHGHSHGDEDPHYWFDMSRVGVVATELGKRLAMETGNQAWSDCGQELAASISAAEDEVFALFNAIDPAKRVIVTDHDAFAYLADRYGFEVAGVLIPGGSTLAEATSQDLAAIVADVKERNITALIGDIQHQNRLLDAVADESGGTLQVVLVYVESIGEPNGDAADYQAMMVWNAQQIAQALQD